MGLTGFVRCSRRLVISAGIVHSGGSLALLVSTLLGMRTRLSTDRVHLRGVQDVQKFMDLYLDHGLPASSEDVLHYAAYAVELRPFRLDSSSVRNYLSGLSAWHIELAQLAKDARLVGPDGGPLRVPNPCRHPQVIGLLVVLDKRYKKPSKAKGSWTLRQWLAIYSGGFDTRTRYGLHHRLLFLFCTFGCLRKGATEQLRVYFRLQRTEEGVAVQWLEPPDPMQPYVMVVRTDGELSPYVRGYLSMDKNVDLRKPRKFYLPAEVPALGLLPVEELEDYIVASGLPSGSRLFSAPKGAMGWHYTPYRGHERAFKRAYARAFPEAADGHLYGSGSARKSLGQWLWTWGWSHRMISDVGGWYTPKVAMDLYFATHRATVLRALAQLGAEGPAVTAAHWD